MFRSKMENETKPWTQRLEETRQLLVKRFPPKIAKDIAQLTVKYLEKGDMFNWTDHDTAYDAIFKDNFSNYYSASLNLIDIHIISLYHGKYAVVILNDNQTRKKGRFKEILLHHYIDLARVRVFLINIDQWEVSGPYNHRLKDGSKLEWVFGIEGWKPWMSFFDPTKKETRIFQIDDNRVDPLSCYYVDSPIRYAPAPREKLTIQDSGEEKYTTFFPVDTVFASYKKHGVFQDGNKKLFAVSHLVDKARRVYLYIPPDQKVITLQAMQYGSLLVVLAVSHREDLSSDSKLRFEFRLYRPRLLFD